MWRPITFAAASKPVVEKDGVLAGIVTVDDVIDVIREEATEDMLKMAGVGEEFVETKSIFKSTRIRLPWLFASFLGGVIAAFMIGMAAGAARFACLVEQAVKAAPVVYVGGDILVTVHAQRALLCALELRMTGAAVFLVLRMTFNDLTGDRKSVV